MEHDTRNYGQTGLVVLASMMAVFLILAGCSSPSPQAPDLSATEPAPRAADAGCTTKDCFIASANDCKAIEMTLTEEAGVFRYASSTDCVFTKTVVGVDASETKEMQDLLRGRSMTCRYEKGGFDPRWVTSLIFGTENCEGDLKSILVDLLAFT